MKKAIVILPTYNEKDNIGKIVSIIEDDVFPGIKTYDMHILVADDNSPDGTGDIVRELCKKYKNLHLIQGEKQGLGAAYVRAMIFAIEKLDADILFEMDADFFHDPKKIPQFLEKIDTGNDFVVGTRYSDGGSIPKDWGLHRKIFSVFGNLLVRSILMRFSVHDWTGGYRALKKEVFLKEKTELGKYKGYTFQVAFLLKALQDGYKVAEVPFSATDRTAGRSKIAPLEYIINLLRFVISERIKEILYGKFGKFLVVGLLGLFINFSLLTIFSEIFHFDHSIANLIGAGVAVFSNFNFNNLWTFKEHRVTSLGIYLFKLLQFYATSSFGVIFIQTGVIFLGDRFIGDGILHLLIPIKYYYVYFVIGTGLLLIWNFTVYNRFIWKKPQ